MDTPNIGEVVWRLVNGMWVEDWACQKPGKHRKSNPGCCDEQGVLKWGSGKDRHQPGVHLWKGHICKLSLLQIMKE